MIGLGNCNICVEWKISPIQDEMEWNFAKTERLSSKKSFRLKCQIKLKDLTKVGLNFALTKKKSRKHLCSKSPFIFQKLKVSKYLTKFLKLAKFCKIFQCFLVLNDNWWYATKCHIRQLWTIILSHFAQFHNFSLKF
jgi:hypothetical protein